MSAVFLLFFSVLIRMVWPRIKPDTPWICPVLALVLPFCAGGFHIATAAALSLILTLALREEMRNSNIFRIFFNPCVICTAVLFTAYCITPLWAADKGMAVFALPKYLPLVLYILLVMQAEQDISQKALDLIPWSGCLMTILSALAACIPALHPHVTVNGRLAGFFQYPNSFAAFLLAALIIQALRIGKKSDFLLTLVPVIGIVLSGSKTVFVLMILFMAVIALLRRQKLLTVTLGAALICGLCAGFLADAFGTLANADRFTDIRTSSGTFLVRLLYFRDVLPTILAHPLGIGYLGYPSIEGSIQTGRYYVTYIHNEFLQLLLEVGWIPGIAMAFALLMPVFSGKTGTAHRLILMAVLAHCMLDFDLQFCLFWIILLSCTPLRSGREYRITARNAALVCTALLSAAALWLGCGDFLYRAEKPDLSLRITPFHTDALAYQMSVSEDAREMDDLADQILALNPTHSLAFSGKANAAFSRGDISAMIRYKESEIQTSRYSTNAYCDYFDKLHMAMQAYLQAGNVSNAAYCRNKLLEIPQMMAAVSQQTHPLAYMTGDDSSLILPPEYTAILDQLR